LKTALNPPPAENQLTFEVADTAGMRTKASDTGEILLHEALTDELWLWIVHKRLRAAGGELALVSNTPAGATFRISIAAGEMQQPHGLPPDQDRPRTMRILVAEDHDDSFFTFEMLVKSEGHHLFRARDGQEALEMARKGGFDLIVMDVGMPRVDGYVATRLIREWETEHARPRSPIVLLSADDPGRLSRIGPSVGCSAFLNKPVRKQELIRALRHYGRR
jgi:CheY-like chemotaxis protein